MAFEVNPDLVNQGATIDADTLREEFLNYSNGLQRYLALTGVTAKPLSPQVSAPNTHVDTHLKAIAIAKSIPFRILFGSEQAQLASSQDARAWNKRVAKRQNKYLTPMLIRPLVDRLIAVGALPEPKEYTVEWPDLNSVTDEEKAAVAQKQTEAMAKYVGGGVDQLYPPSLYFIDVLGMEPDRAEAVIKEAEKYAAETASDEDDEGGDGPDDDKPKDDKPKGDGVQNEGERPFDGAVANYNPKQPRGKDGKRTAGGRFFHGTTEKRANDIAKHGITPAKFRNYDPKVYDGGQKGKVYVSSKKSVADQYARDTSVVRGRGGEPAIVEIQVPKGKALFADAGPETKAYGKGTAFYHKGKIPASWVKSVKVYDHWDGWQTTFVRNVDGEFATFYVVVFLAPFDDQKDDDVQNEGVTANYNPHQPRGKDGRWSSGGAGGGGGGGGEQRALQLPPEGAPDDVKQLYKDRQRAYTRMRQKGLSDEEKAKRTEEYNRATDALNKSKQEHPEFHGKKAGGGKKTDDAANKPDAGKTSSWTDGPADTGAAPKQTKTQKARDRLEEEQGCHVSVRNKYGDEVDTGADCVSEVGLKASREREVARQLDHISDEHADIVSRFDGIDGAGLARINYQDTPTLTKTNSSLRSRSDVKAAGFYDPLDHSITIGSGGTGRPNIVHVGGGSFVVGGSTQGIYRHELAHAVDAHHAHMHGGHYLTDTPQWRSAVSRSGGLGQMSKHVSEYAGTNREEAFAECFSAWTCKRYQAGSLPAGIETFMSKQFPSKQ